MSMHSDYVKTGAAFNRRRAKKNPLELMHDMREHDSTAGRDRIIKQWMRIIEKDDDYTRAVLEYAATNYWESLERDRQRASHSPRPRVGGAASQAAQQARVDALAEKIRNIVLMDIRLPTTGKRIAESTFAECAAAGGWFAALSSQGQPKQIVGKVLSEADLHKIRFS